MDRTGSKIAGSGGEYRAPRWWSIGERNGFYYADSHLAPDGPAAGFTRHDSSEEAQAAIEAHIARYGDGWAG